MRATLAILAATAVGLGMFPVFAESETPSPSSKRTVPPTVFLSFPKTVHVDTVYIYPTSVAFLPRSGLKPHAKLVAELSNVHDRPRYSRVVSCTYLADDHTFWVQMPDDVPPEVAIEIKRAK